MIAFYYIFIKLSENGNNSFTSLDLFEIKKKNHDWSQFLLLICSTDHVYIRNFDMGKDKVKVHSTKTAETISGWSVTYATLCWPYRGSSSVLGAYSISSN